MRHTTQRRAVGQVCEIIDREPQREQSMVAGTKVHVRPRKQIGLSATDKSASLHPVPYDSRFRTDRNTGMFCYLPLHLSLKLNPAKRLQQCFVVALLTKKCDFPSGKESGSKQG